MTIDPETVEGGITPPSTEATLITDGSGDSRNRTGGWCSIIRTDTYILELTGWEIDTTSNRMELMAVIQGLRYFTIPTAITLVADSAYVLNAIKNRWYDRWIAEIPFRESDPRPNIDLWIQLAGLVEFHDVTCIKVKGHSGDYWNTRADKLAAHARKNRAIIKSLIPNFNDPITEEGRST